MKCDVFSAIVKHSAFGFIVFHHVSSRICQKNLCFGTFERSSRAHGLSAQAQPAAGVGPCSCLADMVADVAGGQPGNKDLKECKRITYRDFMGLLDPAVSNRQAKLPLRFTGSSHASC